MIVRRDQPGTGVGNDLFRDGFALDRRGTGEDDLSAVVAGGGDLVDDQSMHPACDARQPELEEDAGECWEWRDCLTFGGALIVGMTM